MPVHGSEIAIAILPFQNLSDNRQWDHFALGLTQDLIIDLSRFNGLRVLAMHTTAQYSQSPSRDSLGAMWGARYSVSGNFRYDGTSMYIRVELIDTQGDHVVWADRFTEKATCLFEIQERLSETIVACLQRQIDAELLAGARTKNTGSLLAYECWLKGLEELRMGTVDHDARAREYFNEALRIDPSYARAFTGLSLSYFNEWSCQLWDRWNESQQGAYEYARKAVDCDPQDGVALAVLGRIYLYQGDYEKAAYYSRRSVQYNPNDPDSLIMLTTNFVFLGCTEEAEALYLKAIRINPLHPAFYNGIGAFLYVEMGQYEKALALVAETPKEAMWVDLPAFIAAAYYHLGQESLMGKYWSLFLEGFRAKIGSEQATVSEAVQWILHANPFRYGSRLEPFLAHISQKPVSWSYPKSDMAIVLPVSNVFKRTDLLWELAYEGKTVYLPEVKGFLDLAYLLAHPGKDLHCAELMGQPIQQEDQYFVLDEKAKKQYQKRIQDLWKDIQQAEDLQDAASAEKFRHEYDHLIDTLTQSLGLDGKPRKLGSQTERIRTAVTWRIRSAIQKIEKAHPSLGKHLANSVETGIFCAYSPEREVEWVL